MNVFQTYKKDASALAITSYFVLLSLLWVYITYSPGRPQFLATFFSWGYGLIALAGGLLGLSAAKKWGGFKSLFGKSVLFFSIGLLLQEFGQLSFTYYTQIQNVEIPYPSIAEIGFLGYLPFYLLGMFYLAQVAGVRVSLRSTSSKLIAIAVPSIALLATYFLFLIDYVPDWGSYYITLVDYAYTLGQAINISAMVIAYLLSRKYLGGVMRSRLLIVMAAYFMQYFSDFSFLYQAYHGSYQASGVTDFMYMLSYFLMSMALIQLKTVSDNLRSNSKK